MVLGHENLAVVEEVGPEVDADWVGCRVCVEPTLNCHVRGIDPPCRQCRSGRPGTCENFDASGIGEAALPAGTSIGYNSRTGGSLGEYFVAHRSQLVAVPEELSDAAGPADRPSRLRPARGAAGGPVRRPAGGRDRCGHDGPGDHRLPAGDRLRRTDRGDRAGRVPGDAGPAVRGRRVPVPAVGPSGPHSRPSPRPPAAGSSARGSATARCRTATT